MCETRTNVQPATRRSRTTRTVKNHVMDVGFPQAQRHERADERETRIDDGCPDKLRRRPGVPAVCRGGRPAGRGSRSGGKGEGTGPRALSAGIRKRPKLQLFQMRRSKEHSGAPIRRREPSSRTDSRPWQPIRRRSVERASEYSLADARSNRIRPGICSHTCKSRREPWLGTRQRRPRSPTLPRARRDTRRSRSQPPAGGGTFASRAREMRGSCGGLRERCET
jgi:hypothetical protein